MATNPSVMSRWFTWLNTVPEKVKVRAPSRHATVESVRALRKTYMPTPRPAKSTTSVAIQATRSGKMTKNPTSG